MICCLAVNDPFVMSAWADKLKTKGKVCWLLLFSPYSLSRIFSAFRIIHNISHTCLVHVKRFQRKETEHVLPLLYTFTIPSAIYFTIILVSVTMHFLLKYCLINLIMWNLITPSPSIKVFFFKVYDLKCKCKYMYCIIQSLILLKHGIIKCSCPAGI